MIKEDINGLKLRNTVTRICDECGIEQKLSLSEILNSQSRKNVNKDLCKKCSYKFRINSKCRGPNSIEWKGGFSVTKAGYQRFTSKWDENGNKRSRRGVYVHKYIYSQYLGRELSKIEQLHHIDMNKQNNVISNMFLCKNKSIHALVHMQMEEIGYSLFGKYIWYNEIEKQYVLTPICNIIKQCDIDKKATCREKWRNGKYYDFIYLGNKKYIGVHRYTMSIFLKRELNKKEHVHHIDGNTLNNDINNLILLNRSSHKRVQTSLQKCVIELYKMGIVGFENGKYFLRENK
jgi:hypothetical protein